MLTGLCSLLPMLTSVDEVLLISKEVGGVGGMDGGWGGGCRVDHIWGMIYDRKSAEVMEARVPLHFGQTLALNHSPLSENDMHY